MHNDIDVLVIGGGIAGITAAIEAARGGAGVALACAGPLFGGSSFYPGTWGLGLVGPTDKADERDLIKTIERVGLGVADHDLVETLVHGIRPAIRWLEDDLNVTLMHPKSPQSSNEAAFIPCFDHTHRLWRGIVRNSLEESFRAQIERLAIKVLERTELMEIVREREDRGRVVGAILYGHAEHGLFALRARSVILASGGTGGLFARSLTSGDVLSSVHGIALDAGCTLMNIEFMQMMPGLMEPVRDVVFNEKTFRYARIEDPAGILPATASERAALLEMRSGHGPFTCRLADACVDAAIDAAGSEGARVSLSLPHEDIPEFIQTFSRWMRAELAIEPENELRVALYAHASNGGIRIDRHARCGTPGLLACGEATGGMHGADRIGGLSSANGLVFGRIAGHSASAWTKIAHRGGRQDDESDKVRMQEALTFFKSHTAPLDANDARRICDDMRRTMSAHCMIRRTEVGLTQALRDIDRLQAECGFHGDCRGCVIPTDEALALGKRVSSQLKLAQVMVQAMLARRESCGSHYRADA